MATSPYINDFEFALHLVKSRLPNIEKNKLDGYVNNLMEITYEHFSKHVELLLPTLSENKSPEENIRDHMKYILEKCIAKQYSEVQEKLCKDETPPESGYVEDSTMASNSSMIENSDLCFKAFEVGVSVFSTPKKKRMNIVRICENSFDLMETTDFPKDIFQEEATINTPRKNMIKKAICQKQNLSNSVDLLEISDLQNEKIQDFYDVNSPSNNRVIKKQKICRDENVSYNLDLFEISDFPYKRFKEDSLNINTPSNTRIIKENNNFEELSTSHNLKSLDKTELYLSNLTTRADLLVKYFTEM